MPLLEKRRKGFEWPRVNRSSIPCQEAITPQLQRDSRFQRFLGWNRTLDRGTVAGIDRRRRRNFRLIEK
jgi:hypothetical protein